MRNHHSKKTGSPVTANTNSDADNVFRTALADLWERDIAELKRTKQPGGKAVCRKLKKAVVQIRRGEKLI
jgi:hypothetical protein